MPRKVGSNVKSVPTSRTEDVDDLDLLDISEELDARQVAFLAVSGQSGVSQRHSLSSDDAQYS